MKTISIILLGAVATLSLASCAATEKTTSPAANTTVTAANTEQEIRSLNLEYDKAIVQQDAAALERLLAEDFAVTKMGGKISNNAQEIADAKSGETKFETGRSEDVKVRLYGDTAIVNGRWVEKSVSKGKSFDGSHLYTTVYLKRNGKWQIVSDQVTPVTP